MGVLKALGHTFGDDVSLVRLFDIRGNSFMLLGGIMQGVFIMEYCDFLDVFEVVERTWLFDTNWGTEYALAECQI
jgi:hypothetical protein